MYVDDTPKRMLNMFFRCRLLTHDDTKEAQKEKESTQRIEAMCIC